MARLQEQPQVVPAAPPLREMGLENTLGPDARVHWFFQAPIRLAFQGHRFYRSPTRFGQLIWAFVSNFRRQVEILRILCIPEFTGLVRHDPIFPLKYLTRDYLVRGLSTTERAACFSHHYQRLMRLFPRPSLRLILYRDMVLVEKLSGEHRFCVRLSFERIQVREGELSLALHVDDEIVYTLQFTIVPGWVVQSSAAEVFLISRIQGMKGCYSQVRLVTKAFFEVAPPALLLAVLQGVAQVCGIEEMACVSAESQFCFTPDCADSFRAAYDEFWLELGATRISRNFFLCSIPPREKPLDAIKNGHKLRTRKKREIKRQIADNVFQLLLGANPDSMRSLLNDSETIEQPVG